MPRLEEPPYPDHPLFNWDFQWHPTAAPGYVFTEYNLNNEEKRKLRAKQQRTFGFAAALDPVN